jgi:Tannase and feruloyl esterase
MRISIARALAAAVLAGCTGTALAAPSDNCTTAALQVLAPQKVIVAMAAREVFADREEVYSDENWGCRVTGWVITENPGPNRVLFTLMLPDNFNGRYLYLGVGGAAGKIPEMPQRLLAKGYALAGSDAGTGAKSIADFSFMSDPARLTDFMWRGVQSSAQATQAMARLYYNRPKIWRYISGCSGGGQMGLGNARRFGGQDFDGFLVGATPFQASLFHPNVFRIAAHMQNKPESWISPEKMKKAGAGILAAYDMIDGAKDGMIHNPADIAQFDYAILRNRAVRLDPPDCQISFGRHPGRWLASRLADLRCLGLEPFPDRHGPAALARHHRALGRRSAQGRRALHPHHVGHQDPLDGAHARLLEDRQFRGDRADRFARRHCCPVCRSNGLLCARRQWVEDDHLARHRRRIDELP